MKYPKKAKISNPQNGSDKIFNTDLSFEEIMKKALNTPLPKKEKKSKKK